jgi:predicted RNA-binding Zn-ribbon protein involved in translation (DUF1610 family)
MDNCDECGKEFPIADRYVAVKERPSDPRELVAVMWFCPECGKEQGLQTAGQVTEAVEKGKLLNSFGKPFLFATV